MFHEQLPGIEAALAPLASLPAAEEESPGAGRRVQLLDVTRQLFQAREPPAAALPPEITNGPGRVTRDVYLICAGMCLHLVYLYRSYLYKRVCALDRKHSQSAGVGWLHALGLFTLETFSRGQGAISERVHSDKVDLATAPYRPLF